MNTADDIRCNACGLIKSRVSFPAPWPRSTGPVCKGCAPQRDRPPSLTTNATLGSPKYPHTPPRAATCATCRFWSFHHEGFHTCRRRAPVPLGPPAEFNVVQPCWSRTEADDWCGEHEPKEQP